MQTDDHDQHRWDRFLKNLGSKDDAVRYQAYAEAQTLPADELLALANAEIEQYRRIRKRGAVIALGSLISVLLILAAGFILDYYSVGPGYLGLLAGVLYFVWFFSILGFLAVLHGLLDGSFVLEERWLCCLGTERMLVLQL